MLLHPKYYQTLVKSFDGAFKEFQQIIELDARRTKAAIESPKVHSILINVLLSYAK
jgi:predicted ATP-binding protein involved in virulence